MYGTDTNVNSYNNDYLYTLGGGDNDDFDNNYNQINFDTAFDDFEDGNDVLNLKQLLGAKYHDVRLNREKVLMRSIPDAFLYVISCQYLQLQENHLF